MWVIYRFTIIVSLIYFRNLDTSEVFGIENPAFAVKDEVIESKVRSNSVIKAGNGAI